MFLAKLPKYYLANDKYEIAVVEINTQYRNSEKAYYLSSTMNFGKSMYV
ncbi:hypothetical protein ANAPC1_01462 [Anaplasma phagocytophilum]|uniref:Uncharacterized protein n=1 Tax=Anaplasma phagocytophilum TaxID=948 RepID=A0AA45UUE1_ANAPH|nr:hypothetical protein ANAPC1_01462 [Anaplasma phagocytophilum]